MRSTGLTAKLLNIEYFLTPTKQDSLTLLFPDIKPDNDPVVVEYLPHGQAHQLVIKQKSHQILVQKPNKKTPHTHVVILKKFELVMVSHTFKNRIKQKNHVYNE